VTAGALTNGKMAPMQMLACTSRFFVAMCPLSRMASVQHLITAKGMT